MSKIAVYHPSSILSPKKLENIKRTVHLSQYQIPINTMKTSILLKTTASKTQINTIFN